MVVSVSSHSVNKSNGVTPVASVPENLNGLHELPLSSLETPSHLTPSLLYDNDPQQTQDWIESLDSVIKVDGTKRAEFLVNEVNRRALQKALRPTNPASTPYINTIPASAQPEYPGNRELERKIKSLVRWNAMAMVVQANTRDGTIGGHISTFASSATLYEVAYNHFFRGADHPEGMDLVYFQGHASPGMYSRAFLEGRLNEAQLTNFRRELEPEGGLSSYPHPWLMPEFWQFPTVSMGLGPIMSIYNARFLRYLENRGLAKTDGRRVWAFLGDGECDEPETLGALTIAAREKLDNLTFVINCNLQRLDGPVRGNGKIIQELESLFRGAGWNVIKVIWGSNVDPLLARDRDGLLVRRMEEVVDGEYQKYAVEGGAYIREHFFGKYPELLQMVDHMSDQDLANLKRGGHDPIKVYSAYKAASEFKGTPTVILAKTVKGYGMGEAAEGLNISHQQKKLKSNNLIEFRNRFSLPLSDEEASKATFLLPEISTPELTYLHERRKALGGHIPSRRPVPCHLAVPGEDFIARYAQGSGTKTPSTTGIFVDMLGVFLKTPNLGKHIVPIVPDEARTFGMDPFFTSYKIYSPIGQLYDPVDSRMAVAYRESKSGQLLEEGINESGSMSSFIAAGSSHASNGIPMIPFYTYYSMFGFQRVGDLIWAASDTRVRGFLLGATSGRTSLNGEGLQHEDGHSQLMASTVPTIQAYDPGYAHELAVILRDGIKRMYGGGNEDIIYYISIYNDNYPQVPMPSGSEEGILRGLYKLAPSTNQSKLPKVHIFGSGPILVHSLAAQKILAEMGIDADIWSATSYKRLRLEALEAERHNLLHPLESPKRSYLEEILAGENDDSIYLAVSDNMRQVPEMISRWVPGGLYALGTDGFGRSETRTALRRHFEIDAEFIVLGALSQLMRRGKIAPQVVADFIKKSGINPDKICPLTA